MTYRMFKKFQVSVAVASAAIVLSNCGGRPRIPSTPSHEEISTANKASDTKSSDAGSEKEGTTTEERVSSLLWKLQQTRGYCGEFPLSFADCEEQYKAIDELGTLGNVTTLPTLISLLGNGHAKDRHISEAIKKITGKNSGDNTTISAAVHLFEEMRGTGIVGYSSSDALATLVALNTNSPEIQKMISPLIELLDKTSSLSDGDWNNHFFNTHIAAVLAAIDGAAEPALIASLSHKKDSVRAGSACALGALGSTAAIDALVHVLSDSIPFVSWEASKALINIGSPATPALKRLLYSSEPRDRDSAAWIFAEMNNYESVPDLIKVLDSCTPMAAYALGKLGDKSAVEPLIRTVNKGNAKLFRIYWCWEQNNEAMEALGKLGDQSAIGPLVSLMKRDPITEYGVLKALTSIAQQHPDAAELSEAILPLIKLYARDPGEPAMRRMAAYPKNSLEHFMWEHTQIFMNGSPLPLYVEVQNETCTNALYKMRQHAVPGFAEALNSNDRVVRKAAMELLPEVAGGHDISVNPPQLCVPQIIKPLTAALSDWDPAMRLSAIGVLNVLAEHDLDPHHSAFQSAVAQLMTLRTHDKNPEIRDQAAAILQQLIRPFK